MNWRLIGPILLIVGLGVAIWISGAMDGTTQTNDAGSISVPAQPSSQPNNSFKM